MIYIPLPILFVLSIYLGVKKPVVALITCPFIAGTLFLLGASEENPIVILSAGIIFLSTIIAIIFSKTEPDEINWAKITVRYFIQIIFSIVIIIAMFVISPALGFVGIVFVIMFIGSVISYLITSRYSTIAYVISTIGSCIRQNLPLPMALETAASGQNDKRSRILLSIKKWLVQGYSLSESIKRGFRNCPGYAIAMITAAEKINQLPMAVQAIENNMSTQAKERNKIRPVHPIYPLIVMCFMFCISSGIIIFVIPQFANTLAEMTDGGRLPYITRLVLGITNLILVNYGFIFLALFGISILVILPMSVYVRFRPRNSEKPYFVSIIGDKLKWYLPILHWFEKNYSMVQTIEMLRLSLNAGYPVNNAIANTTTLDVNCCFRKKLRNWLIKVESGLSISESAEKCGLGSALSWAFDDKVNQGNTMQILEALESFYRKNYSYCVNLARFIFWPCVIILLGALVFTVILAIYLPMIEIINSLVQIV
ncbi:MAG: type II secretion system F family protein [Sedimentisphaerales bacterium]|nr:type II secretion system F family protein [Sedimentisphaerales bacterium]